MNGDSILDTDQPATGGCLLALAAAGAALAVWVAAVWLLVRLALT